MNPFEVIYRLLVSFFGDDLADYLSGYVCPSEESEGGFLGSNHFVMYSIIALVVALVVMLVYYYAINSPKFNTWKSWLLMLLLVGMSNLLVGALNTSGNLAAGEIGECLVNGGNGGIYAYNCWMFGFANFLVSAIFFIIFSFAFKWKSTNCKYSPF
ncbi:MAG: hypothetical protein FWF52_09230 [Candidatus Azobacteroides sp.]|nr:hypothetical protein [Candidatus Azobacteroides sp.]